SGRALRSRPAGGGGAARRSGRGLDRGDALQAHAWRAAVDLQLRDDRADGGPHHLLQVGRRVPSLPRVGHLRIRTGREGSCPRPRPPPRPPSPPPPAPTCRPHLPPLTPPWHPRFRAAPSP